MKKVAPANLPQFEAEMLAFWRTQDTFKKSLELRKGAERFSFYDGPPFANGLPHYGHVVPITIKDSITRYKTMQGYYVPRRNGWDTHGLPVEYEIEKELGIKGKRDIYDYGVEKFIEACRASVFKYRTEWEEFFERMGRWSDKDDAYATLDDAYIESVWWAIKQLHQKELLYETFRSMPYCPRCATPLSNFEVNQNYKDNTPDPSIYVKFELVDKPGTAFLAWTTTPWTLPANAALAVDAKADYVTVELQDDGDSWRTGDRLILAKKRLSELELRKAEYKLVETHKGRELVGIEYKPLYSFVDLKDTEKATAHRIYADKSVDLGDGTGILHVAPRYGETDLELGQKEGLPLIESVDSFGRLTDAMGEFSGLWFKEADPRIIEDLTKQDKVFAAETFEHTYPFCWRCETPLMYFATPSWNVKVTEIANDMVGNNNKINWVPDHVKKGRFGNWLADARDWGISRNRFWGNPLPIWRNESDPTDILVIGSLAELKELAGELPKDLHRPHIDKVIINRDGKTYRRVEEVLDCWFESGSMPFAQDHYPFANKADFDRAFPAQFIAEGIDQTRGWFYTLHVLGTALFDKPAFENVVVNGLVMAADGKKLSKRLKNYPPMEEVFDTTGVDVLRFFMMSSPVVAGENVRFSREALADVQRNLFLRLWNVLSFFSTYAEIDNWQPQKTLAVPASDNVLDVWLLARLSETITEVTKQADDYQISRATRPLQEFVDDLSNWYVRRSRRRFWKSEDDGDKRAAYATLHYVMVIFSQLLAPWSPFISDKIWRELTDGMELPESVHLSDWPTADNADFDILAQMSTVRDAISEGLAVRAEAGIKVRQPLATATIYSEAQISSGLLDIVKEELNVKKVEVKVAKTAKPTELDTSITDELRQEGMARDVIRQVQQLRKTADLKVDQKIRLYLSTSDNELNAAINANASTIENETLANSLGDSSDGDHRAMAKINGVELSIGLSASE
jgi:isoleucyl-tRNA synthetase